MRWTCGRGVPFFGAMADRFGANFMTGARLVMDEPTVLGQVVGLVDGSTRPTPTPRATCSSMCSSRSAGELGQFRARTTSSVRWCG